MNIQNKNFSSLLRFLLVPCLFMAIGCSDDFLDLEPKEGFSEEGFFKTDSDLRTYANGFYNNTIILRRVPDSRTLNVEAESDNAVGSSESPGWNTRGVSGQAPLSAGWGPQYELIRSANFFIGNAYKAPRTVDSKHYTGEGYFVRAASYFDLLKTYGGVPLITEALNTDSEDLYKPRSTREEVARQILKDLDSAIVNLSWKGNGPAADGRLNKESALLFKTRVGLFEGSWERYHGSKNTPFAMPGNDGAEFLTAAVAAGETLIGYQGSSIFEGSLVNLFDQIDYSNVPGAFFYKVYSQGLSVTNNFYGSFNEGTGYGITKQLVDQVLMNDGMPQEISGIANDDASLRALGQNKDPRLSQTIWTRPVDGNGNTIRFYDIFRASETPNAVHSYKSSYPGLVNSQQRQPSLTGYRPWKGVVFDYNQWRNGEIGDLIYRYAEALLNYAEAKAILGSITQSDLDKSVNLLRARANMPPMTMSIINGWGATYSVQDGYDPGAMNIVNEIRRERRVELALEGFRRDDLKRWAVLDDVMNGFKPLGASAQEFLDYWNQGNSLLVDEGFDWAPLNEVVLSLGNNCGLDSSGNYFLPFFNSADFGASGAGGYIDGDRDYLSPIGSNEIQLYSTKGGVELTQNPGWF